jgi:hypothetical protein
VPTAADTTETIASGANATFTLTPAFQRAFTIPSASFPLRLWLTRNISSTNRTVTVTLTSSSGFTSTTSSTLTTISTTTPTLFTFTMPNLTAATFPVGSTLTLTVANGSSAGNSITVVPNGNALAGNNSRLEFASSTVINVDSVQVFNAAYSGGATQATFYPGATVYVRATVGDPFGSFDIGSTTVSITDPSNVTLVSSAAMIAQGAPATCNSTSAATCVFEYAYIVPAAPTLGGWTVRVTANEGTENTVSDFGVTNFQVVIPQPSLTFVKTSTVLSDPLNNTTNPKRIPQSIVRYDLTMTNTGPGTVDANTLVLTDAIPTNTSVYVSTSAGNPIVFANGTTPSGLTYAYPANVTFSNVGETGPWTYTPVADANGFDAAVRAIRVAPAGTMSAAGAGNPSFTIQFRVRVN